MKETDTETCHFHSACKVERWGAEGIQEGHIIPSVECAQGLSLKRYAPVIQEYKKSRKDTHQLSRRIRKARMKAERPKDTVHVYGGGIN